MLTASKKDNCARRPSRDTKDTSDTKDASLLVGSVLRCRKSPTKGFTRVFFL